MFAVIWKGCASPFDSHPTLADTCLILGLYSGSSWSFQLPCSPWGRCRDSLLILLSILFNLQVWYLSYCIAKFACVLPLLCYCKLVSVTIPIKQLHKLSDIQQQILMSHISAGFSGSELGGYAGLCWTLVRWDSVWVGLIWDSSFGKLCSICLSSLKAGILSYSLHYLVLNCWTKEHNEIAT